MDHVLDGRHEPSCWSRTFEIAGAFPAASLFLDQRAFPFFLFFFFHPWNAYDGKRDMASRIRCKLSGLSRFIRDLQDSDRSFWVSCQGVF